MSKTNDFLNLLKKRLEKPSEKRKTLCVKTTVFPEELFSLLNECNFKNPQFKLKLLDPKTVSPSVQLLGKLNSKNFDGGDKEINVFIKLYSTGIVPEETNLLVEETIAKYAIPPLVKENTPHIVNAYNILLCNENVLQLTKDFSKDNSKDNLENDSKDTEKISQYINFINGTDGKSRSIVYEGLIEGWVSLYDFLIALKVFNNEDFLSYMMDVLFQILWTLLCLSSYGINHNDLHLGNILIKSIPVKEIQEIVYDTGQEKFIRKDKVLIKIIDFDFATWAKNQIVDQKTKSRFGPTNTIVDNTKFSELGYDPFSYIYTQGVSFYDLHRIFSLLVSVDPRIKNIIGIYLDFIQSKQYSSDQSIPQEILDFESNLGRDGNEPFVDYKSTGFIESGLLTPAAFKFFMSQDVTEYIKMILREKFSPQKTYPSTSSCVYTLPSEDQISKAQKEAKQYFLNTYSEFADLFFKKKEQKKKEQERKEQEKKVKS